MVQQLRVFLALIGNVGLVFSIYMAALIAHNPVPEDSQGQWTGKIAQWLGAQTTLTWDQFLAPT